MAYKTELDHELIKYANENLKARLIPQGHEEYEKMISGMKYKCGNEELILQRHESHQFSLDYSSIRYTGNSIEAMKDFRERRKAHLKQFIGEIKGDITIEAPFSADYGTNTSFGHNFYSNFNLTLLDSSIIRIGDHTEFGPNVVLCCATHPLNPEERGASDGEWALPITIGSHVWLGANVTVLPGVTIGAGVVIGANSMVNKDIPAYSVAVGAPARVIKQIEH